MTTNDNMKRQMRLDHTFQILGSLNRSLSGEDDSNFIPVQCQSKESISVCNLVLAALSPVIKDYLLDLVQAGIAHESLVIAPDLSAKDFGEFIATIFEPDNHKFQCSLRDISELLNIPETLLKCEDFEFDYDARSEDLARPESSSVDDEGSEMDTSALANDSFVRHSVGTGDIGCHFCTKMYRHVKARNKHVLAEHLELCKVNGLFHPCDYCRMFFTTVAGKEKHVQRTHGKLKERPPVNPSTSQVTSSYSPAADKLRCPFSDEQQKCESLFFKTLRHLREHAKKTHTTKDKSCLICARDFRTKEELFQHIQSHSGPEGRFLYSCEHCQFKLISEYALMCHKREVHSVNSIHECKVCGKTFRNAKFCRNHEEKHNSGQLDEVEFRCEHIVDEETEEVCNRTFANKHNLERHVKSHDGSNSKNFHCTECGKSFVDSTRLKHHKWVHSGYHPYQCEKCDKGFRHISHLRNHQVKFHGEEKKFGCQFCEKRFLYAYQLKTHTNSHKNKEMKAFVMDTVYQCALCQEMFKNYDLFQQHSSKHSNDNDFTLSIAEEDSRGQIVTFVANESTQQEISHQNNRNEQLVLQISEERNDKNCDVNEVVYVFEEDVH